ncbi:MAG: IS4 family transposase [Gammaproteobacteria bacterium]
MPLPKLMSFVLSLAASGAEQGMAMLFEQFAERACDQGAWPRADAVHASALTKARAKLSWCVFDTLLKQTAALAQTLFPAADCYQWKGMSVYAIDGSKYQLPASVAIRAHFDPDSGLHPDNPGRGHYPMALVSTAYDVFRQLPVARAVVSIADADERIQAQALLPHIPPGGVLVFDQGYPSYDMLLKCQQSYDGYFLFRCPAKNSFSAVEAFIRGGKSSAMLELTPTLRVRAIRLRSPDGNLSVLLTNLIDPKTFSRQSIVKLYLRRWKIEDHYRAEKRDCKIECFHSRSVNGVKQELFAAAITMVMAQTLKAIAAPPRVTNKCIVFAQSKNAVAAFAQKLYVLTTACRHSAIALLERLAASFARHRYYQPKTSKPGQPRVSKTPQNKWRNAKQKRMGKA